MALPLQATISLLLLLPLLIIISRNNNFASMENPIDFIENSNLSASFNASNVQTEQSSPVTGLQPLPRFVLTQPTLNHFGVTYAGASPAFLPSTSTGIPMASSTRNMPHATETGQQPPKNRKRGRPELVYPSWFDESNPEGFYCTFCKDNHLHSDNSIWTIQFGKIISNPIPLPSVLQFVICL